MKPDKAKELIDRLDRTLFWTLTGGNDPDDSGSIDQAVKDIGDVLIEVIQAMKEQENA